jgi:hypothetical protein
MTNYTEIPELAHLYLEDSYVLGIAEGDGAIAFELEAVLTPGHPAYAEPRPGEQHGYVKARLTFADATEIRWLRRSRQVYRDATGESDLGNIDTCIRDGDHYEITGDWGEVRVFTSAPPRVEIAAPEQ